MQLRTFPRNSIPTKLHLFHAFYSTRLLLSLEVESSKAIFAMAWCMVCHCVRVNAVIFGRRVHHTSSRTRSALSIRINYDTGTDLTAFLHHWRTQLAILQNTVTRFGKPELWRMNGMIAWKRTSFRGARQLWMSRCWYGRMSTHALVSCLSHEILALLEMSICCCTAKVSYWKEIGRKRHTTRVTSRGILRLGQDSRNITTAYASITGAGIVSGICYCKKYDSLVPKECFLLHKRTKMVLANTCARRLIQKCFTSSVLEVGDIAC